jgi:pyrroline-5-carboxylate reductase
MRQQGSGVYLAELIQKIKKEKKNMKIGFIGLGNMANAMIGGILSTGLFKPEQIIGSSKTTATAVKTAEKYKITTGIDNKITAQIADVIVLAIKPVFFPEVINEIKDSVDESKLVISIAAGRSIEWIEHEFGKEIRLVRCMPNTPAMVGEGCTCVCLKDNTDKADEELVLDIMKSFGKASIIPERLMDAFIGVAGSSPAYVFMFIEALADGAVAAGMSRSQAYEFAAQSVLGSAKLVLETGRHPGELKDMVCSPGGTTIEAVKVLEEKGFRAAVIDAVEACVNKCRNV